MHKDNAKDIYNINAFILYHVLKIFEIFKDFLKIL